MAVFLPHMMGPAYPQWLYAVIVSTSEIQVLRFDKQNGVVFLPKGHDLKDDAVWFTLPEESIPPISTLFIGQVLDNPLYNPDEDLRDIDITKRNYFRLPM